MKKISRIILSFLVIFMLAIVSRYYSIIYRPTQIKIAHQAELRKIEKDVSEFMMVYHNLVSDISESGRNFSSDLNDPVLQKNLTYGRNDVPLVRFVAKKQLSLLEANGIKSAVGTLSFMPGSKYFSQSMDRLRKSSDFLIKFYTNSVNTESVDDFKQNYADFVLYQQMLLGVGPAVSRDYNSLQYEIPDADFSSSAVVVQLLQAYSKD